MHIVVQIQKNDLLNKILQHLLNFLQVVLYVKWYFIILYLAIIQRNFTLDKFNPC